MEAKGMEIAEGKTALKCLLQYNIAGIEPHSINTKYDTLLLLIHA